MEPPEGAGQLSDQTPREEAGTLATLSNVNQQSASHHPSVPCISRKIHATFEPLVWATNRGMERVASTTAVVKRCNAHGSWALIARP
uniref:Uncharacterized protein n=1 Tax=mine drainage metagenome TaxID=410659 RepID=E6PK62_9ZZZZ